MRISLSPPIDINLNPGLYLFDGDSGNGKTYLRHALEKYLCTYRILLCCGAPQLRVDPEAELMVFDRGDLYKHSPTLAEAVRLRSRDAIVLADIKDPAGTPFAGADRVRIKFDKERFALEVYPWL